MKLNALMVKNTMNLEKQIFSGLKPVSIGLEARGPKQEVGGSSEINLPKNFQYHNETIFVPPSGVRGL